MKLIDDELNQILHEIKWLENKIEGLKRELSRKPSVSRQIMCLANQIKEKQMRIISDEVEWL